MKILCAEYNEKGEATIVPIGDDVLLRNNGDFYIPEFTRKVSCVPQLAVKICKLGKSVNERFACRYYSEMGGVVRFYADTLEDELREKGLPLAAASSFDCSAAISNLKEITDRNIRYEMQVNGISVFQGMAADLVLSIDRLLALASEYHMIKIGDYLFCGNQMRFEVKAGDRIRMLLAGEVVMDYFVR